MSSVSQETVFKNINDALCLYFQRLKNFNFIFKNINDAFLQYVKDEELIDEELPIENELGDESDPNDCAYYNADIEFPTPHYAEINDAQKEAFVYYILQYCYKYSKPPSHKYMKDILRTKLHRAKCLPIFRPEHKNENDGDVEEEEEEKNQEMEDAKLDRWNDVIHHLADQYKANSNQMMHFDKLINHCRKKQWNINEYDGISAELKAIIKSSVAESQSEKLFKSFESAVVNARQNVEENEIKCSQEEYEKRYKVRGKIIENIQILCASKEDPIHSQDKQLKMLSVSFDFKDILLMIDVLLKTMCECINYGEYTVLDQKCLEKEFNLFVRYEFPHYLHKKLKLKCNEYFQAMNIIIRRRYLSAAKCPEIIQRIETEHEERKNDEYDDDDEKTDDFNDWIGNDSNDIDNINNYKIDFDLRATRIAILSFAATNLRYVLDHCPTSNCIIALNIEKSPNISLMTSSFETEMDQNIDAFTAILENAQNFNDNVKKKNIVYWTLSEQKSKQSNINLEFIGRDITDIDISLDENEYAEHYAYNPLFHVGRVKKLLMHKVGVSIHIFNNTIKLYWHHHGSMLPSTAKDVCCSEWFALLFNSRKNALNEQLWKEQVHPYLKAILLQSNLGNKSNYFLDNTQNIKYISFIKRLSYYSDLFKRIYKAECIDYDENENTKCTEIDTFKSKYGCNMEFKISVSAITALWIDFEENFEKESDLHTHIEKVVLSQINVEDMMVFNHRNQEKAVFAMNLYDKYHDELLYGIMQRDYDDKRKWLLDDYKTAKQVITCYPELAKLPLLQSPSPNKKQSIEETDCIDNYIGIHYQLNQQPEREEEQKRFDIQWNDSESDENHYLLVDDEKRGINSNDSCSLRSGSPMDGQTDSDLSVDETKQSEQKNDEEHVLAADVVPMNLPSLVLDDGPALYPHPVLEPLGKYGTYSSATHRGLIYSWEEWRYYYHYECEYSRLLLNNNKYIQIRMEASCVLWILRLCMLYKRIESNDLLKSEYNKWCNPRKKC